MNTLSWFLILADILPALSNFIISISIGSFGLYFFFLMSAKSYQYAFQGFMEGKVKINFMLIIIFLISMIIGLIIPSKETFYLIAASELGEEIISNPEVNEMTNKIKTILDLKIEELKDE